MFFYDDDLTGVITVIAFILIVLFFATIVIFINVKNPIYYYECVDYTNETIKCTQVETYKTDMKGLKEDGTWIKINSYKEIRDKE